MRKYSALVLLLILIASGLSESSQTTHAQNNNTSSKRIQELTLTFEHSISESYQLLDVKPDDKVYVYVEDMENETPLQLNASLRDSKNFREASLMDSYSLGGQTRSELLDYHILETSEYYLYIDANLPTAPTEIVDTAKSEDGAEEVVLNVHEIRVMVGINAPEVLTGTAEATEEEVLELIVSIGEASSCQENLEELSIPEELPENAQIQLINLSFDADKTFHAIELNNLQESDRLAIFIPVQENISVVLLDSDEEEVFAQQCEDALIKFVEINYDDTYKLVVINSAEGNIELEQAITLGLNAPHVLQGNITEDIGDTFAIYDSVVENDITECVELVGVDDPDELVTEFDSETVRVQALEFEGFGQYELLNLEAEQFLYLHIENPEIFSVSIRERTSKDLLARFECITQANLSVNIPENGDYVIILQRESFELEGTTNFSLLAGINAPDVLDSTVESNTEDLLDEYITVLDEDAGEIRYLPSVYSRGDTVVENLESIFEDRLCQTHVYNLNRLYAGDTLFATAQSQSPQLDPFMLLLQEHGQGWSYFNLIQQDDDSGAGLNAHINFAVPTTGGYRLVVGALACPEDETNRAYTLTLAVNEANAVSDELRATGETLVFSHGVGVRGQVEANQSGNNDGGRIQSDIQSITGTLESDSAHYYYLFTELEAGDEIYAYAESTSGNVSPQLTLYRRVDDTASGVPICDRPIAYAYGDIIGNVSILEQVVTDNIHFCLQITSHDSHTFGDYTLRLGINQPDVTNLNGEELEISTETQLAKLNATQSFSSQPRVEAITATIEAGDNSTTGSIVYALNAIERGDTLYIYVDPQSEDVALDVGVEIAGRTNPLQPLQKSARGEALTWEYPVNVFNTGATVTITGDAGDYQVIFGINEPLVLNGEVEATEEPHIIFNETFALDITPIDVGIELHQISGVDQKAENFSIVAILRAQWSDSEQAFHPITNDSYVEKRFTNRQFIGFLDNTPTFRWPEFVLANQQGERNTQSQVLTIQSNGQIYYEERFTVTLQAPDFNFEAFPFDTQIFKIRLQTNFLEKQYVLRGNDEFYGIGDQLGEEEWILSKPSKRIENVEGYSQYIFEMEVVRHRTFYTYRILIPLLLIICMGWAIIFIRNYEVRIAASSGNLLLFIAFNFTIGDDLPRLGYLTFMDLLLIIGFVITSALFALDVFLYYIIGEENSERARRIDRFVMVAYPLVYIVAVIYLSQTYL